MEATAEIGAGVCGFHTTAHVSCEDGQHVTFEIETPCESIARLAEALREKSPIDAFEEIRGGNGSVVLDAARAVLCGCCAAAVRLLRGLCASGMFKAMQVAAGLALPADITIALSRE